MNPNARSPFLSVAQLGVRLGVSTRTAYNLVRAGEVPVIEFHGRKRIPVASFEQWLADREAEALAAVKRPVGHDPRPHEP